MKPEKKVKEVFNSYLNNQCSHQEIEMLLEYFDAEEHYTLLESLIRQELNTSESAHDTSGIDVEARLDNTYNKIKAEIKL